MLTMTTTTVGIFMYKCGLCPACVGKRLIIWRQQAASRVAHMKRSHIIIVFLATVLLLSYMWMMYPQIFFFIRYHAWRANKQAVVRDLTRLRRNMTFSDVCSRECVPDVDAMMASGYDVPYQSVADESFTIVTVNRHSEEILKRFLMHYSKFRRVNRITVHWTTSDRPAPNFERELDLRVQIVIKYINSTSLLKRFASMKEIRTEGVLLLDDDILLSRDEVYRAYSVWKIHPWGIVGYYGGNHVHQKGDGYKHSMVPFNYYSMIQQGVVFLHREYLRLYVDKFKADATKTDCDDFALNFAVSSHCRCAAAYYIVPKTLYVKSTDKLELLSTKWQYNAQNNVCLNYYTNFFGGMPLKSKTCFW